MLLTGLLYAWSARAACEIDKKATIALADTGGVITVPVEVNGITATFVLDTGAERSIVTEEAVHHLGLVRDEWVDTSMRGVGGIERRPNANPRSLTLGGIPLVRRTLNHDTSLTVGIVPRTHIGSFVIDGFLGRDFLSLFDLDLDVPNRRLTLYYVQDCAGRFLPWQSGYTALPVTFPAKDALVLPVTLDGMPLRALLDTGASASMVGATGLFRLGLQPAALGDDPAEQATGLGSHAITLHQHRFRSLQVGGQEIVSPVIWVAKVPLRPIVDMLLGADWLAKRRIWISFTTHQLFVSD
jgi:hypothetical protein